MVIAYAVEDWYNNPNKKSPIYAGDGGQLVNGVKEQILDFCKKIHNGEDI